METTTPYQQNLIQAQHRARELLGWIESKLPDWVGRRESEIVSFVEAECRRRFECSKYWHRSIVRAGPNTVLGFSERGDDVVFDGSLIFFDLGPVFQEDEADFGKSFSLMDSSSVQARLCKDSTAIFEEVKGQFLPSMSGADVYSRVVHAAEQRGWQVRVPTLGHIVGEFPHQNLGRGEAFKISPMNHEKLLRMDPHGRRLEWILEVHIQDTKSQSGAFFEDLLTL